MLPKFLLADNSQELPEAIFVMHTEDPRFILQGNVEDFSDGQTIHWLDDPITDEAIISDLVLEAEDFLSAELDNEDALYEQEFGEDNE